MHTEMRTICKILIRKPEGKKLLLTPGINCLLHSSDSGYGPVAGSCEHSNERLGSIKSFDQLSNC
jgi:hypothetical protein